MDTANADSCVLLDPNTEPIREPINIRKDLWESLLPPDPVEKQNTLAVLSIAADDPKAGRDCFENGWDGSRRLKPAREFVKKALPLLEEMRWRAQEDRENRQPLREPQAVLPFGDTIKKLRRAGIESRKLRVAQRKADKETRQLKKDVQEMHRVAAETSRLVKDLEKQQKALELKSLECRERADRLEAEKEDLKVALTKQTIWMFRHYAGIEMDGHGRPVSPENGRDRQAGLPVHLGDSGSSRPGNQLAVTRAARSNGLKDYGGFAHDHSLKEQVLQRLARHRSPRSTQRDELAQSNEWLRQRRALRQSAGKEPRSEFLMDDEVVSTWETLRELVYKYQEDPDCALPDVLLEPDGRGGPTDSIDSCWWHRFLDFWAAEGALEFQQRNHAAAKTFLDQHNQLLLIHQQQRSPGEEGPSCVGADGGDDDGDDDGDGEFDLEQVRANIQSTTLAVKSGIASLLRFQWPEDCMEQIQEIRRCFVSPPSSSLGPPVTAAAADSTQGIPTDNLVQLSGLVEQLLTQITAAPVIRHPFPEPPARPSVRYQQLKDRFASKVKDGLMSSADASSLLGILDLHERRLLRAKTTCSAGGSGMALDQRCSWGSVCLGYLKDFLVSAQNCAYLRGHAGRRASVLVEDTAPVDVRIKRHETLAQMAHLLSRMQGPDNKVPVSATNSTVKLWSNYVHRDSWVPDFPMCTLSQALEAGDRVTEMYNLAKPWNYAMGGWFCIRCVQPLSERHGDCSCRCFRGHTRTECARPGSGCFGFHPNRFLEYLALGLPHDRNVVQRSRRQRGGDAVSLEVVRGPSQAVGKPYHRRSWDARKRWALFRTCIKMVIEGQAPWFGVVDPLERLPDCDGLVDDVAPLIHDWFYRLEIPQDPRGSAGRCQAVAKYQLDLLLDPSKYLPRMLDQIPPEALCGRGTVKPSWNWISDRCPICGMSMHSNLNERCRGLCSGCRAWPPIRNPQTQLINRATGPYRIFLKSRKSAGQHKRRKQPCPNTPPNVLAKEPQGSPAKKRRHQPPLAPTLLWASFRARPPAKPRRHHRRPAGTLLWASFRAPPPPVANVPAPAPTPPVPKRKTTAPLSFNLYGSLWATKTG